MSGRPAALEPAPARRSMDRRQPAPGAAAPGAGRRDGEAGTPLSLERAERLGHRSIPRPGTAPPAATELRRKIGAEIEAPGATLHYDKATPATQGEKVGAIVPGIETEIHLEAPKDGMATFEFATGLHDQVPPDDPTSLAFQAGYLGTWMETGEMLGEQRLADGVLVELEDKWEEVDGGRGPLLRVDSGVKGAFQVNVSPTRKTAPTLLSAFDTLHAFSVSPEDKTLVPQKDPVNQALKDARTYSIELFQAVVQELAKAADRDPLPPRIVTVLKALTSVPRAAYFKYLRRLEGFTSASYDIIDKNIVEVLPRADLSELWAKAVQDDPTVDWNALIGDVLASAVGATPFPRLRQKDVIDTFSSEVFKLEMEIAEITSLPFAEMEKQMGKMGELQERWSKLAEEHGTRKADVLEDTVDLENRGLEDMLAVLAGDKVLVKDRGKRGQEQPPSILTGTDSTLLPVNPEQGEAGVYEIRNPFTEQIPLSDWGKVMALYEQELWKAGVRF